MSISFHVWLQSNLISQQHQQNLLTADYDGICHEHPIRHRKVKNFTFEWVFQSLCSSQMWISSSRGKGVQDQAALLWRDPWFRRRLHTRRSLCNETWSWGNPFSSHKKWLFGLMIFTYWSSYHYVWILDDPYNPYYHQHRFKLYNRMTAITSSGNSNMLSAQSIVALWMTMSCLMKSWSQQSWDVNHRNTNPTFIQVKQTLTANQVCQSITDGLSTLRSELGEDDYDHLYTKVQVTTETSIGKSIENGQYFGLFDAQQVTDLIK